VLARWAVVAVTAGGLLALWDAGTGLRDLAGVTAAVVVLAAAIGCSAGLLTGRPTRPARASSAGPRARGRDR
jgi:hypothetical protein